MVRIKPEQRERRVVPNTSLPCAPKCAWGLWDGKAGLLEQQRMKAEKR